MALSQTVFHSTISPYWLRQFHRPGLATGQQAHRHPAGLAAWFSRVPGSLRNIPEFIAYSAHGTWATGRFGIKTGAVTKLDTNLIDKQEDKHVQA